MDRSPTAGGQYHWISEFSPRFCQKYLSYLAGWLCLTGWQASICAIAFLVGNSIQALIILHQDTYGYERWHGSLLTIAIVSGAFIFNTVFAKRLPLIQGLVLVVHICGLFAVAGPLWALSPRKPARAVFTEFSNNGGWDTMGLSFMVGLMPLAGSLGGIDCVVHMGKYSWAWLVWNSANKNPHSRRSEGCLSNHSKSTSHGPPRQC